MAKISTYASKTTPVDADSLVLIDSAASNATKRLTWANLKATIKAYYDAVVSTLTNKTIALGSNTVSGTKAQFDTACTDGNFLYTAAIDTDTAMAANSDALVPSQKAAKAYADTKYGPGGTDVAVADGGTGASTAAGARTSLDLNAATRPVTPKTGDYTVLAGDHNTIFTNTGAGGDVTFALPASGGCTAGKTRFTFFQTVAGGQQMLISVAGSDHLFTYADGAERDITGGGSLLGTVKGNTITVMFLGGTTWGVESQNGTWTV